LRRTEGAIQRAEVEQALEVGSRAAPAGGESKARLGLRSRRSRRDYVLRRALALSDFVALSLALLLAFSLSPVEGRGLGDGAWFIPLLPAWVLLFYAYGLYAIDAKRINHGPLDDVPGLFHSFVVGLLLSWAWFRILPVHKLVFGELVIIGVAGTALVELLRGLVRRLVLRWYGRERVLFVGDAPVLEPLMRKIRGHPEYGLDPVAVVAGRESRNPNTGLQVLGRLGEVDLGDAMARVEAERVILIQADVDDHTVLDLLQDAASLGTKVSILPHYVDAMGPSVEVDDIEGVTVLGLSPLVLTRSSRVMKRAMDLVGAGAGLLLLAPVMAVAAIAIKLDSPGPVLFRQERIGKGGRRFWLNKFRTMDNDAEQRVDELLAFSEDAHWLKLDRDPRVTRVGRLLRLLSVDELPQLWNVLRGDMSLVGPRPLIASEDERIRGHARLRLHLAPGITGLWQVMGRTTIPFEEMVKLDYIYVANWSLWSDIKLLLKTFPAVVHRRGAN
jgi:exopolysaccharide biosynthesis polyprenyl glycosylphosphotransferase